MRAVTLGGSKARGRVALVDDEDFELVSRYSWHVREYERPPRRPMGPYAITGIRRSGKRTTTFMHNLILGCTFIDHANGDGLDNRRANLRPCVNGQNMQNRRPNLGHSSAYKGVNWHSGTQRWSARITVWGDRRWLGLYESEVDAALAYDAAARAEFGEFARPNLPLPR